MPGKLSILIIDDEDYLRRTLELILGREGYRVETAATGKEAWQWLEAASFDLVFLDLKLPDASGLSMLPELRSRYPLMPVLILTATDHLETAIEAVQMGARDYLLKPLDPHLIIQKVKEILAEREHPRPLRAKYSQLQKLLKERHSYDEPLPPPLKKPAG